MNERDAVTEAMVEAALITFRTSAKVTMPEIMRDTLRAALASRDAVGRDGWQPIETAPDDVERALVGWFDESGEWAEQFEWRDGGCWMAHADAREHYELVGSIPGVSTVGPREEAPYTHWMPLPAPPAQELAA